MNARWTLLVAVASCGIHLAEAQAQYTQPASQFGAQQAPQYNAQVQNAANNQPTLPPPITSSFGQQGGAVNQPNTQTYPPGSSFTAQGQTPPRSSVFSAQPTANSAAQGWTGAVQPVSNVPDPRYSSDPRYTASTASDPRYAAPQLSPPENATLQQYGQQLNTAATQFSNTLRDAQQQAQQYGQQAQQLGQTARDWQQQAQQLGQQAQPYLSSLTNNPYAYVPAQPQPDLGANQYLAANSQTAESQFGRSVLVNSQGNANNGAGQNNNGQYANNGQFASNGQYDNNQPSNQFANNGQYAGNGQQAASNQPNNSQPYTTSGSQFAGSQQQPTSSFDNRTQLYQPETNPNSRLTSGQSAFTNSGQSGTLSGQDPRLMQPPTNDPRYAQAQDPRLAGSQGSLTLDPPLSSTLPAGSQGQMATTGGASPITSPYTNVQAPRADAQNGLGSNFGNTGNNTLPNNASTTFGNGTKSEVPNLVNNLLPTNGSRLANGNAYNPNQFGATLNSAGNTLAQGAQNVSDPDRDHLWNVLIGCLVITFASIGANFYFGWNFTEYYFRYRKLLVEGDDDDRSRDRDDDRRR